MTECPSGKRTYSSLQQARKALRNHRGSWAVMHAYRCNLCKSGYHIGHLDPRGRALR